MSPVEVYLMCQTSTGIGTAAEAAQLSSVPEHVSEMLSGYILGIEWLVRDKTYARVNVRIQEVEFARST